MIKKSQCNNKIKIGIILFLLLFSFSIKAEDQEGSKGKFNYTIYGRVTDSLTGETLTYVNIVIKELKTVTLTNAYGFYSLTIQEGDYTINYSRIGYGQKEEKIHLDRSMIRNIELSVKAITLEGISVNAELEAEDDNIELPEMSAIEIKPMEIRTVPILLGEQDILKTIQLMPGVKSAGEGNSGFYVRGGSADQNLILLDEAPVYNASHLLGFFSVFNSDAIKNVKLMKGTAPAEYGGRLSSVLDIKMNEGNSKRFSVSGGIGLIASRLTLEGPIVKDKGSFIISGRRTYADIFLQLSPDESLKDFKLYFYDLNLKSNYRFSDKDRIFLSGYFGRDVIDMAKSNGSNWGNSTLTLRWNHLFSNKLFSNTSLIYSNYDYEILVGDVGKIPDIKAAIEDFNFKEDLHYFIDSNNSLKFGLNSLYYTFKPGEVSESSENSVNYKKMENKYALENAVYISHELDVSIFLKFNYGLRYSMFTALGPGDVFSYDENGEISEITSYSSGEIIKHYEGFEPRFTANYLFDEKSSTKISYSRNRQYIHLLSNSTSGTPIDLWFPSSKIIKPGISDQLALGYFRNFDNNNYETSVEIYYKDLQNQVDYKNDAEILMNEMVESQLVFGKGWAYGVEFFLKKRYGKLNGWIGYTLSKSEKKFADIDDGDPFPARQDRTHDISIVGNYELNEKWTLSSSWVYSTGDAVTFPSGKYEIDGHTINLYTERNGYRMPAYHRLDFGTTYHFSGRSSINFSVYNAYARKNAYTISFRENEDDPSKTEAVRMSLFQIVPAITYNFKF